MRRALLLVLVALLVLAGAAGTLAGTGHLPGGIPGVGSADAAPSPSPTPSLAGPAASPPPPVLPALAAAAPVPRPAAVGSALDRLLAAPALGKGVGAVVLDGRTGSVLYDRQGAQARTPASVTKLATAVAALRGLGPDARLRTRVVAGASPGQVVLVGAGDPTLTARPQPASAQPRWASLVDLADATAAALRPLAPAQVQVAVDDSLFTGPAASPTWPASYTGDGVVAPVHALALDEGRVDPRSTGQAPRVADPALETGRRFAALLAARGLHVSTDVARTKAPASQPARSAWVTPAASTPGAGSYPSSEPDAGAGSGTGPADRAVVPGAVVAAVDSPPVSVLVQHMLRISDDDLAEALGRLAALSTGRPGSFEGTASALLAVLGPGAGELHDASGLSRQNALAPMAVARLLAGITHAGPESSSDSASESAAPSPTPSSATPAAGGGTVSPVAAAAVLDGLPVAGFTGTLGDRFSAGAGAGSVRAKTGTLTGVSALAGEVVDADGRLLVFAVLSDTVSDTLQARADLDRVAAALAACGCR